MINNTQLIQLEPSDKNWLPFIESFPRANIFHHPAWINLLSTCYGFRPFVLGIKDDNNQIIAGLPILDVKSILTGRRWVSLPFTDFCSPLYRDQEAFIRLTNELVKLSLDPQVPRIEIRWELPPSDRTHCSSRYVQHTIDISQDIESIARNLHRTQRQNIKTAEKNGVEIKRGTRLDDLKTFYKLHSLTRRRQGVPVQPWRFFQLLYDDIIKNEKGFILLAYKDDHCLAAGLFLHWNQTLSYKYAASDDKDQDLRPNHLLTWDAINWGHANGYTVFDFGRTDSSNEGLRTFKCRWGAQESPLSYSVIAERPPRESSGRITSIMNRVLKKTSPLVGQIAGEILYKHFG